MNAYWEGMGNETAPVALENALLLGADPKGVGASRQDINDHGYGVPGCACGAGLSGQWRCLVVHLQSAKGTACWRPGLVVWYPRLWGNQCETVVQDGPWTFTGSSWGYLPMEPGLVKLSFVGDWVAESAVSFKVHIMREN